MFVSCSARTTELESGDSLSPIIAPDTMVLTVYMGGRPRAPDIPMKATPKVEIVPQDVPITIDVAEHITNEVIRKNFGLIAFRPMQIRVGTVPLIIQLATRAPISRRIIKGVNMVLIDEVTTFCSSRYVVPLQIANTPTNTASVSNVMVIGIFNTKMPITIIIVTTSKVKKDSLNFNVICIT